VLRMAKIKLLELETINIIENVQISKKMFVLFISQLEGANAIRNTVYSLYIVRHHTFWTILSIGTESCDRFGVRRSFENIVNPTK